MRLKIDLESVDVLRDFGDRIPLVLESLANSTEKLLNLYNSYSNSFGPHKEMYYEMIQGVQKSLLNAKDSVDELSYMLKCTADKMESFIIHGGNKTISEGSTYNVGEEYSKVLSGRLNNGKSNDLAINLYDMYYDKIAIEDFAHKGVAFYNSMSKGIVLNALADMHNPTGAGSTYFHEVGHMIDDLGGIKDGWLSSDSEFRTCLVRDVDSYIQKTMIGRHCEMTEAYDVISEELAGEWNAGISDIYGSLTSCRCQGDWGHDYRYWQGDDSRIQKEAFANMFEASIGSEEKIKAMKKYCPLSYARFEYIVRRRLNDKNYR